MSGYRLSESKVCFFVHLLLEGLQRSYGVVFVDIKEWLGCSRQLAVIPFALSKVVSTLVELFFWFRCKEGSPGPLIGWGCLLSAVGMGFCFLAINIVWQSVFWGIIFGSGIGITTPLILYRLSKHKENSAKSSLKSTGPSLGCIVLPFLINKLTEQYDLNGCYTIISSIILNCLPFVLISFYGIRFHWLKIKWHLRKRSKTYDISRKEEKTNDISVYKPKGIREFYNQSFMENLEPDTLERISEKEGSQSLKCSETIDILQPNTQAKMKVENPVNHREPFELDNKYLLTENSEKQEIQSVEQLELVENEIVSNISENQFGISETKHSLPNECVESINSQENQQEVNKSVCENGCLKVSEIQYKKTVVEKYSDDSQLTLNIPKDCLETHKNQNNQQEIKESSCENICLKENTKFHEKETLKESETENEIRQDPPAIITTLNQTFQVTKEFPNPKNQSSKEFLTNFPLEIKVHVVECTITTTEDFTYADRSKLPINRNGYRRHSNSLVTASYENIDFTQLFQNNAVSPLHKQQWNCASKMCLIIEEGESDSENHNTSSGNTEVERQTNRNSSSKQMNFKQSFQELVKPSCLAVIYASVIYEFSLAVLLTIFDDFAKDTGDITVTSNMVLLAFGLGGIVGQLSFNHWGNKFLLDGSHAAATVIFILNGLAVAGILWSINVAWLSGFYALLGFVETGVMMTLPKLISDYTTEKARTSLYVICKCLSAIAFMCIPYAIGQSRDATGDYDGLLQVISCMSVVCAILCYFLPKWSGVQYNNDTSTRRDQVQV